MMGGAQVSRISYSHSSAQIDRKVAELRRLSLDEIASEILDREIELEECAGKLDAALERLADQVQS